MKVNLSLKKLNAYHKQALAVAEQSPDAQTKVGALLIHGKTGAVISSGYNGFVRGGPDKDLPKTRPDKYQYIIHAETNLLCNCARHGVSTDECFVYCTLSPCINCMRQLYQSGINMVYFKDMYRDFDKNSNMKDLKFFVREPYGTNSYYELRIQPARTK